MKLFPWFYLVVASCVLSAGRVAGETIPEAAFSGNLGRLIVLLEANRDPNESYAGATGLHVAAEWGHLGIAEELLRHKARVDALDSYQRTALLWALTNNHRDIALLLIKAGADANRRDPEGNSPLAEAVRHGDVDLVRGILAAGVTLLASDERPLREAVVSGNPELVRLLLAAGANACSDPEKDISAFAAAVQNGSPAIVKLMIERVKECRDRKVAGQGFRYAAAEGNLSLLKLLFTSLKGVIPVSPPSEYGKDYPYTKAGALRAAVERGRHECVRFLIEEAGFSSIELGEVVSCAIAENRSRIFDLLIEHGAAWDVADIYGRTPLLESCDQGDLARAKLFLKHHASVHSVANSGLTPLLAACRSGNPSLVQLLLKSGSTINEKDSGDMGPFFTAVSNGKMEVCAVLVANGCDVNAKDPQTGFTALHFAVERDDLSSVQRFLVLGANSGLLDNEGRSARDLAEEKGFTKIFDFLRTIGSTNPGKP